MLTPARRGTD